VIFNILDRNPPGQLCLHDEDGDGDVRDRLLSLLASPESLHRRNGSVKDKSGKYRGTYGFNRRFDLKPLWSKKSCLFKLILYAETDFVRVRALLQTCDFLGGAAQPKVGRRYCYTFLATLHSSFGTNNIDGDMTQATRPRCHGRSRLAATHSRSCFTQL
jgi:hypothetical protein